MYVRVWMIELMISMSFDRLSVSGKMLKPHDFEVQIVFCNILFDAVLYYRKFSFVTKSEIESYNKICIVTDYVFEWCSTYSPLSLMQY